ncbi:MAG TPA: alpha/beta hydrolase [Patescibacteria group bacterium]|nr:alpha/beta hydrolase [Patescibacteria group bacterium]
MRGVFRTENYEIRYERSARTRYPIFLIPPFPGSEYVYKPLIKELLKDNPKADFVNFTLPGLGGRNKLFTLKNLKTFDYAVIVSDFIRSFNPNSYSIIATSFGGYIAGVALSKKLIEPRKLILISPIINSRKLFSRSLKFQRFLLLAAYKMGFTKKIMLLVNNIYIWLVEARKWRKTKTYKNASRAIKEFETLDVDESIFIFDEIAKRNSIDLEKWKKRILLTVGDRDNPDIIEDCQKMEKKGFILKWVVGGTHGYIFWDPEQLSKILLPFLFEENWFKFIPCSSL